jgi:NO-binding membrane sensor protein with MHYT domain
MRLNIAGLCFTDQSGISPTYNGALVTISFVIAAVGAYSALEMIARMRTSSSARARCWRAGSAVALGGSIWSMHFVAMLAINIPFSVTYNASLTALSLVVAIAVVALGLEIGGIGRPNIVRVCAAGTVIGLGVASMHYIGMAAIIFSGSVAYAPGLWGLSILIAISAAGVSLWLSMTMDDALERSFAAIIMAVAVFGMHFTGMAATVFQVGPLPQIEGIEANRLAMIGAGITLSLAVLVPVLVSAVRRLLTASDRGTRVHPISPAMIAAMERERSTPSEDLGQKRTTEQLLAKAFEIVDIPMAIITDEGMFLMTNLALDRLLDCSPGALVGQLSINYVTPICRERISKLRDQQMIDRKPYTTDAQFSRTDGSAFCMRFTSAIAEEESLHRFRIITLSKISTPETGVLPRTIVAGKIKFIGLEEMEVVLGADWSAVSDRIMSAAERTIRSCLTEDETCSRSGNCGFNLDFGTVSEDLASSRAGLIEENLREALVALGEDPATLQLVTATTTIVIPKDAIPGGDIVTEIIDGALDARLLEVAPTAPRAARPPVQLAGCLFEPVLTAQRGQFVGHFVGVLPSNLRNPANGLRLPHLELQTRVISSVEQLIVRDRGGPPGLIFVDLNVESILGRSTLDSCLALYNNCSPAIRSQLVILLSGWPSGIPSSRVRDLANCLTPVCRNLGIRLDELTLPKFDLSLFDTPYVAVEASQVGVDCSKNGKLEKFVSQLRAKRARVFVREVPSMTAVRHLQSLGVDFVSLETHTAVADMMRESRQVIAV